MSNSPEAIGYGTVGQLSELLEKIEERTSLGQTTLGEALWIPGAKVTRTPREERVECPSDTPSYTVRVGLRGSIDFFPY